MKPRPGDKVKQYELLHVYVNFKRGYGQLGDAEVVSVIQGSRITRPGIGWLEFSEKKGKEGYSLQTTVPQDNFGLTAGFLAIFQRESLVEEDV
jgi:hypothetical protein